MNLNAPPLTTTNTVETVNDVRQRNGAKYIAGGDVPVAEWIARQIAEVRAMDKPATPKPDLFS